MMAVIREDVPWWAQNEVDDQKIGLTE